MAIAPVVTDISALVAGQFVVEMTDFGIPGGIRQFASKESGSYAPVNGTALPSVAVVTPIPATGPAGAYRVILQVGAGDAVSATSPMVFTVTPNAQILTNATAN